MNDRMYSLSRLTYLVLPAEITYEYLDARRCRSASVAHQNPDLISPFNKSANDPPDRDFPFRPLLRRFAYSFTGVSIGDRSSSSFEDEPPCSLTLIRSHFDDLATPKSGNPFPKTSRTKWHANYYLCRYRSAQCSIIESKESEFQLLTEWFGIAIRLLHL
jgi:hypothetical protein